MNTLEQMLAHYGVKGMKWGIRKRSSGKSGPSGQTRFSKEARRLSDQELNRRIKRLETERKYNNLNAGDIGRGRKAAGEILAGSGKTIAKTVVTNAGLLAVGALVAAKFGEGTGTAVARRLK